MYALQHGRSEGNQTIIIDRLNALFHNLVNLATRDDAEAEDSFSGLFFEFDLSVGALDTYQTKKSSMKSNDTGEWRANKPALEAALASRIDLASRLGAECIRQAKSRRLHKEAQEREEYDRRRREEEERIRMAELSWENMQRIGAERLERERRERERLERERLAREPRPNHAQAANQGERGPLQHAHSELVMALARQTQAKVNLEAAMNVVNSTDVAMNPQPLRDALSRHMDSWDASREVDKLQRQFDRLQREAHQQRIVESWL